MTLIIINSFLYQFLRFLSKFIFTWNIYLEHLCNLVIWKLQLITLSLSTLSLSILKCNFEMNTDKQNLSTHMQINSVLIFNHFSTWMDSCIWRMNLWNHHKPLLFPLIFPRIDLLFYTQKCYNTMIRIPRSMKN